MKNIVNNATNEKKKSYIWNTINSMLNAGMSAFLLLIVTRICGTVMAGSFTLAYSVAQLMVTIAYFELRPYQVTDVNSKYTNSQYFTFKLISCFMMILVSVGYIVIGGYDANESILIILLCFLKMIDAYEEYFITLYQRDGRLYVGAKKSSIRLIVTILAFCVVTILTKDMYKAVTVAIIVALFMLYFFFHRYVFDEFDIKIDGNIGIIKGIFVACFPLFLGSYLMLYIGNSPKYAIDTYMTSEYQTYYGILYMPSFIINLLSGFIFKPLLTDMSECYFGDRKKYKKIVERLFEALLVIFLVVLGVSYIVGIPILNILYSVDLSEYKADLMIIILGGAISAIGVIIMYMLTIMRCQKWLIISYIITAVVAYICSPILVKEYGIRGASIGFLIYNLIRIGGFVIILKICERQKNK